MLAFITSYIPNLRFVNRLVPPALLALLQGRPKLMVSVVVTYSVINFVIQSIIEPKIMAEAVSHSLTLAFLSLVFWVTGLLGHWSSGLSSSARPARCAPCR